MYIPYSSCYQCRYFDEASAIISLKNCRLVLRQHFGQTLGDNNNNNISRHHVLASLGFSKWKISSAGAHVMSLTTYFVIDSRRKMVYKRRLTSFCSQMKQTSRCN